jgi:hypothetical protein
VTPGAPIAAIPAAARARPQDPAHGDRGDAAELARLGAEVADLRTRTALAEAQVEATEGRESAWPANVAPEYRKESVEQQLKEFVVDRGLAKIDHLDCSEFPCVGVLELSEPGPAGRKKLQDALGELSHRYYNGRVALTMSSSQVGSGTDAVSLAGVSITPNDEDVKIRTRHRASRELQDRGH